jgi:hypothetical protein
MRLFPLSVCCGFPQAAAGRDAALRKPDSLAPPMRVPAAQVKGPGRREGAALDSSQRKAQCLMMGRDAGRMSDGRRRGWVKRAVWR